MAITYELTVTLADGTVHRWPMAEVAAIVPVEVEVPDEGPGDDEEPAPQPTHAKYRVVATNGLNVRATPNGVKRGILPNGTIVIVKKDVSQTAGIWVWRQLEGVEDAEGKPILSHLLGFWCAEEDIDGSPVYLQFVADVPVEDDDSDDDDDDQDDDGREPISIISAADELGNYHWPDPGKAGTANNNVGGAIRELLWYGFKRPGEDQAIYPTTDESQWDELLFMISQNGVRIVRVYLAREEADEDEAIARARRFIVKAYEEYGVLVWLVVSDSHRLGTAAFTLKGDEPWHKGGGSGHLVGTYWRDKIFRQHVVPFGRKAMLALRDLPGFHALSWYNEPAIFPDPDTGESCSEQDMLDAWTELYGICEELIPDKLYGPDVVDMETVLPSLRLLTPYERRKKKVAILKSLPINHWSDHLYTRKGETDVQAKFISENSNNNENVAYDDMMACRLAGVVFSLGEVAARAIHPVNRTMMLKNGMSRFLFVWKCYAVCQWAIAVSSWDNGTLFPVGGWDPADNDAIGNRPFYDPYKGLMLWLHNYIMSNLVISTSPKS